MSKTAKTAAEVVERLGRRDPTLEVIDLTDRQHTDSQLAELGDCLLAHPDVIRHVWLGFNQLTDETGVKLARYVAASSTIEALSLRSNQLGEETYLALAAALRVNSSLPELYLDGNQAVDRTRIDAAFVEALRLNPDRPAESKWWLYSSPGFFSRLTFRHDVDFERLRALAQAAGPISPSPGAPDAQPSTGGDERVRQLEQQLGERDQAAQLRDVQASLEASQTRCNQLEAREQAAQAEVRRLQHELDGERARSSSGLLDRWTYPLSSVHIDQEAPVTLGEGALGSVVRAQWRHTTVALKRLHFMDNSAAAIGGLLSAENRQFVLGQFLRECETNARLRHPNIVAFLGLIEDGGAPRYLMLEHMAGGTLHDLVHSADELSSQRLHGILLDVCKALHYLHALRPAVLHLDVKPKNVLLDGGMAKLADLGEAHIVQNTATLTRTVGLFGVGTPIYMAPEMHVEGAVKTSKADMFSLGVMAAECAARKQPEPLPSMQYVDGVRVVLIEEERRMADIAAVDPERWPHVREVVAHLIVERVDDRWSAEQALAVLQAAN